MESFNPFSLEGKIIIVTGASSGIGQQCAIDCSKMGATVILIARNEERLRETLSQMENQHQHLMYSVDLCDLKDFSIIIKDIVAQKGKINGLLNCAGISSVTPLKLLTEDLFDKFFKTNVYSAIALTKEVCRMGNYSKDGCSIVFFSSVMGSVGEKGKALYSATKGALVAASRSLACELSSHHIRVNTLSPGAIVTPINSEQPYMTDPDKRKMLEDKHLLGLGTTSDIANACIYLLSDASRWVTGINLFIDGGYTAR